MSMEPVITEKRTWLIIETPRRERKVIPEEHKVLIDETIIEKREGHGAYWTRPGYLDQSDTSVHDTVVNAFRALDDTVHDPDSKAAEKLDVLFDYLKGAIELDYEVKREGPNKDYHVHVDCPADGIQYKDTQGYTWQRKAHIRAMEIAEKRGLLDVEQT